MKNRTLLIAIGALEVCGKFFDLRDVIGVLWRFV
jgi:hypothetical protein